MSWTLLFGLVLALGIAVLVAAARRAELVRMEKRVRERERAVRQGSAQAQLQHPVIDLSRCLGCGTCVAVCPEQGVLELVHGQALVVNGARCAGVSACERECPVGAITVTLTNLEQRTDVPVITHELEAVGSPGLFLAGEVTAHALIKTAIDHGVAVAAEVAARVEREALDDHERDARLHEERIDLCIVGAGPAGLACSLEAKRRGLSFVTIDQEPAPGGTVAKYPRRKLVLTQPVDLPLHGRLARTSYTKEELIDLWHGIAAEHELDIRCGEILEGVERDQLGGFLVNTSAGTHRARHVCLALGRRGTPTKLGVPGEELAKVAYSLIDAHSYQNRRILVVGGGDSAIEAALGLAEQPGNDVTLSYRREAFFRIRTRNEERLREGLTNKKLRVVHRSQVRSIRADAVELEIENGSRSVTTTLPNDEVFVMAGGIPPFELLGRSGVSFDPALREKSAPIAEQGTGLLRALTIGFALALAALLWALANADYYMLPLDLRPAHAQHDVLRPSVGLGLVFGIAATLLVGVNLLYLVRRSPRFRLQFGSLRTWMTSHVATGILALLCATLHAGMSLRDSVGGHALWALIVLLVTGAIGRYFYAYVPRAANGRELELEEVRVRVDRLAVEWDASQKAFVDGVRSEISALIDAQQWKSSFAGRVLALFGGQRELRRVLGRLAREGEAQGIPRERVDETLHLARKAHGAALTAAHFEDLRAVLNTWRYLHRYVAALMVALLAVHIAYALIYGSLFSGGSA